MNYTEFLQKKVVRFESSGFEISQDKLNPALFDFQRYCVQLALRKGRFAFFQNCGLGKSVQQLDWSAKVSEYTKKPVLLLSPLGVTQQTIEEGEKFGIEVEKYASQTKKGLYISNYEQIDNIDCEIFGGISLDESAILKNHTGAYKNKRIDRFKFTPYKLCSSAVPSPNDPMELGNHAEFLNVMGRNEMLAMFFTHDGGETSKWKIKAHARRDFWRWVSSWAVMLSKPSDIGFLAEGYDLPDLNLIERKIFTSWRDNGRLINDVVVNATNFNAELRLTKIERLSDAAKIVNESDESFIVWLKQNEEADLFRELVPEAVEVRGSDRPEVKEERLLGFAKNNFRVLATKTKIAQFGLNYQNCHNQVFASLDFSFEGLYQAIRRSYRFGQKQPVNIYLITTDTMENVMESIRRKEREFKQMQTEMIQAMNEPAISIEDLPVIGDEYQDENCHLLKGDCVRLIERVPDESIGFSIFSPPFASLYTYSDKVEDMGNCKSYEEFLFGFDLLVKQLYRVMWQGRNVAVHCMDLPIQKGKEGYIGLRDFSGMLLTSFCGISEAERLLIEEVRAIMHQCISLGEHTGGTYKLLKQWLDEKEYQMAARGGFIYHSRVTIWKDPVTEMQRTKALGLLHKQVKKDAAMSRVGLPDYLLVFRKPGEHMHPVHCDIPVDVWQKYASPVWYDINYSETLNMREGRSENDERHICPLQLQTIERAIHLWSNKGDRVLTPFGGIGSEVYKSIELGRQATAIELKDSYFETMVKNYFRARKGLLQEELIDFAAA